MFMLMAEKRKIKGLQAGGINALRADSFAQWQAA
jgi:hypothetical protein